MNDTQGTQFRTEGQPAFPVENKDDDTSSDSSSVNDTDTDTTTDSSDQDQTQTDNKSGGGKDDNFAEHPRWKERESDWTKRFNDQEQRHLNDMTKLREDLTKQFGGNKQETNADTTPVEVPAWFGGEEKEWKQFVAWNQGLIAKAKEEARTETLNEINNKSTAEQKAIDDATTYFNEQVTTIESDKSVNPQGIKVDRNKLLKFVLDNDLVDSKGRWNYRAGFVMMRAAPNATAKSDTDERKKIAGATTSENRSETKQSNVTTSEDFSNPANRPW